MIVTRLKVVNVRAIEAAEFRFQPGMNLISGVNGVGKTSVLDSLGVCLSAIVKHINKLRTPVESFALGDIRIGAETLTVECEVRVHDSSYTYLVHKPRETSVPQKKKMGMPREQVYDTPERAEFEGDPPKVATGKEREGVPLAVLFSTRRAVSSERIRALGTASGGISAANAEAFANRELRLTEFAAWIRVQQRLRRENPSSQRMLNAFEEAVTRFLPGYSNLRASNEKKPKLLIDHGDSTLEVRQLSDGERGMLAMVLDITRRLAQANKHVREPAKNAEAIVLIDEIDLHLHPAWQRQIVANLSTTFPKCQFIATTHSPQVLSAVEPEQVVFMTSDRVERPQRISGMDSNWILRYLMDAGDRPPEARTIIDQIEQLIESGKFKKARAAIAFAKNEGWDFPEWSVLEARMARLELLAK